MLLKIISAMTAGMRSNEIDRNLEGVLTLIDEALRSPHPASLCEATLPREDAGEGWS